MHYWRTQRITGRRLQLVFDTRVKSIKIEPDATLADIARAVDMLPLDLYGPPVAINVTLERPDPSVRDRKH